MDKNKIIEEFIKQISKELQAMKEAALNTYTEATHEDSKAENKYDTRGLEASYLAGAQAKRVSELQELLLIFENFPIRKFSGEQRIDLTALVQIKHKDKVQHVLLMPKGGGQTLEIDNKTIQVITPESPIGSRLKGQQVDDEIEIELGNKKVSYEIVSVE